MWTRKRNGGKRTRGFFRIGLTHDSLVNYYQTNFSMMQHYQYSLTELEGMIPWEREVYVNMLLSHLEEEHQKAKQRGY